MQAVRLDLSVYSLSYLLLVIRVLFFSLGLEQSHRLGGQNLDSDFAERAA